MTYLFVKLTDINDGSIAGPALVVKNVSRGPFEVDADGRTLHSMGIAAIDESCSICKAGIDAGKLVVLRIVQGAKPTKSKVKTAQPVEVESEPTVAVTQDNSSVQWESN